MASVECTIFCMIAVDPRIAYLSSLNDTWECVFLEW